MHVRIRQLREAAKGTDGELLANAYLDIAQAAVDTIDLTGVATGSLLNEIRRSVAAAAAEIGTKPPVDVIAELRSA